jgi:hypothetical protein
MVALASARVAVTGTAPRHVGHAVVEDVVHVVDGLAMRGGVRRLEAAARVDRDVDDHRAGPYEPEHLARHEARRQGARHEHRPDHHVGPA